MGIAILGGTVGTGKFDLYYGANEVAKNIQATTNDSTFKGTEDFQNIVGKEWCDAMSEMQLVVTEAPAATLKIIVWLLESKAWRKF